jgi:purine nucleosidase
VEVALGGPPSRGMTIVDWARQGGRPDNARILRRYDQARFEAMIRGGLAGREH